MALILRQIQNGAIKAVAKLVASDDSSQASTRSMCMLEFVTTAKKGLRFRSNATSAYLMEYRAWHAYKRR